ncbi:hypothetical protein CYMTET_53839, partial [Cymbomonas tetramitiformis]
MLRAGREGERRPFGERCARTARKEPGLSVSSVINAITEPSIEANAAPPRLAQTSTARVVGGGEPDALSVGKRPRATVKPGALFARVADAVAVSAGPGCEGHSLEGGATPRAKRRKASAVKPSTAPSVPAAVVPTPEDLSVLVAADVSEGCVPATARASRTRRGRDAAATVSSAKSTTGDATGANLLESPTWTVGDTGGSCAGVSVARTPRGKHSAGEMSSKRIAAPGNQEGLASAV